MELSQTEVVIEPEINELVPGFCLSRRKDIQKMNESLLSKDFISIAKICHTIKGIARPYGFPTLETMAKELEAAAKTSDSDQCRMLLVRINEYLQKYN